MREIPGVTSRWVADDSGTSGLSQAVARAGDCLVIVTAQGADGSLVGACCVALPMLSVQAGGAPPALFWALDANVRSLPVLRHATHIALNFFAMGGAEADAMARRFADTRDHKFSSLAFEFGLGGAPLLELAVATFECENRLQETVDAQGRPQFSALVRRYWLAWSQAAASTPAVTTTAD